MTIEQAIWIPYWYELDQPIEVGLDTEFEFFIEPPESLRHDGLAVFANGPDRDSTRTLPRRILKISNAELGDILKVSTDGLVYSITLADGSVLEVEAEENPGKIENSTRVINDWRMVVEMTANHEDVTPDSTSTESEYVNFIGESTEQDTTAKSSEERIAEEAQRKVQGQDKPRVDKVPRRTNSELTSRQAYKLTTDTVAGPNLRWKDNVFQALAILVCIIIGAIGGAVFGRSFGPAAQGIIMGALICGFGGLVFGFFGSGIFLMIFRGVKHARGKHD